MRLRFLWVAVSALLCTFGCEPALTFDAQGVAHGTGERVYRYASGHLRLSEEYRDGKLVRSRWFKPDGRIVHETRWVDGTGEGIYVREDGSIRARLRYVNGVAEGEAVEYDDAGNITKLVRYRGGQRIAESGSPTTRTTP